MRIITRGDAFVKLFDTAILVGPIIVPISRSYKAHPDTDKEFRFTTENTEDTENI